MPTPFKSARGLEANILAQEPKDGYVWFAYDTHKIYYSNGSEFIQMGGSSDIPAANGTNIYYGKKEFEKDTEKYIFSIDDLDNNSTIPEVNNLILNIPDGSFYRIVEILEDGTYDTLRLMVAGSGGGGSSIAGQASVEYVAPSALDAAQGINFIYGSRQIISVNVIAKNFSGQDTYGGSVVFSANGKEILRSTVTPGINNFDIGSYIPKNEKSTITGSFYIDVESKELIEIVKTWRYSPINMQIRWDYDVTKIHDGNNVSFNISVTGDVTKKLKFTFDDKYTHTSNEFTTVTSRIYEIPKSLYGLSHGAHKVKVEPIAILGGQEYIGEAVETVFICVDVGNTNPIIAIPWDYKEITQYSTLSIPITMYNINALQLLVDGEKIDEWTELNTSQGAITRYWYYTPSEAEDKILTAASGMAESSIALKVVPLDLGNFTEVEEYDFRLKLSDYSSNEALQNLEYKGIKLFDFSDNFDWINGGLKAEKDEQDEMRVGLLVKAGTRARINYYPFKENTQFGRCIKIVFKINKNITFDVDNVISCRENNIGFSIGAQQAIYSTSSDTVETIYIDNEYIEHEIDIDVGNKRIIPWLNGIPVNLKYFSGDMINSAPIMVGSDDCDVYIYMIKVYNRHLTDDEHIRNFCADATNYNEIIRRCYRNDILNDDNEISYIKLMEHNPEVRVHCYDIPKMTINKKDKVSINSYKMYYKDTEHPLLVAGPGYDGENYTEVSPVIKVQGTSSADYGLAAFNIDTDFKKSGMKLYDAEEGTYKDIKKYALTEHSIPVNYFNTKVNVASCEGANNACNAEWYNRFQPYKTEYRKKVENARDTMEFLPGVMFVLDRNQNYRDAAGTGYSLLDNNVFGEIESYLSEPFYKMYSVCNFGNSKKNVDVFHDAENENECCIEVTDNQREGQWMIDVKGTKYVGDEMVQESILDADINDAEVWKMWCETTNDADFDFRYPELPDADDEKYEAKMAIINKHRKNFYRLVSWFAKNNPNAATGKKLEKPEFFEEYTIQGQLDEEGNLITDKESPVLKGVVISDYAGTYEYDTYEYRMAKMISECEKYIILDSVIFHYLFIERHTMVDNVAKNTFWGTEDGMHWQMTKNYDNDTADGINNSGKYRWDYGVECMDNNEDGSSIFNANKSVWFNFVYSIPQARQALYNALDEKGAWKASTYLEYFKQFQDIIPERIWVEDYYRKYIRPKDLFGEAKFNEMLQGGKKTLQRQRYEINQEIYLGSKYGAPNFMLGAQFRGQRQAEEDSIIKLYVTMYNDCYIRQSWGQTPVVMRVKRNTPIEFNSPLYNMTDSVIVWYGPSTYAKINVEEIQIESIETSNFSKLSELVLNGVVDNSSLTGLIFDKGSSLLRKIIMRNCVGYNSSLDLSALTELKEIDTRGSTVTGLTLPNRAPVQTVKASQSLSNLIANNLMDLQELDFEEELNNIQYLYLDNIDNNSINSLNDILDKNNVLLNYQLKNVNWYINDAKRLDNNNYQFDILERIRHLEPRDYLIDTQSIVSSSHDKALTGKLLIGKDAYSNTDSINFYYTYSTIFPDLDINFEHENSRLCSISIYNGDGQIVWKNKVRKGTTITSDLLATGPYGAYNSSKIQKVATMQYTYEFNNKWTVEDKKVAGLVGYKVNEDVEFIPQFDQFIRNHTISFYQGDDLIESISAPYGTKISDIYPGEIPYRDDSELPYNETYAFIGYSQIKGGSSVIDPERTVRQAESLYAVFEEKEVYTNVHPEWFKTIEYTYTDEDSKYNIKGRVISIKDGVVLKGKITIPSYINGEPVIGLADQFVNNSKHHITHIFFEDFDAPIRFTGNNLFEKASGRVLKYYMYTNNLRVVGVRAFQNTSLDPYDYDKLFTAEDDADKRHLSIGGQNSYKIGYAAYNGQILGSSKTKITLHVSSSVEVLSGYAISNIDTVPLDIVIGSPFNPSKLDLDRNEGESKSEDYKRIKNNVNMQKYNITMYHNGYTANDTYRYYYQGKEYTIQEVFGEGNGLENLTIIGV